jgi:RNA polymerase sigma-70 factor (ECF subfamily)
MDTTIRARPRGRNGGVVGLQTGPRGASQAPKGASAGETTAEETERIARKLRNLAETNYRAIYHLIYSYIGGDQDEAEDLTLQTFENAFASYHRFRGDADVRTWVFRIAINVCKNRIRQKQTRRRFEALSLDASFGSEGEDDAAPFDVADDTQSPTRVSEATELREVLREGIRKLPHDYREVLLLKLQDFSYKEIAEMLECTVETIKSRLFRARVALRQLVGEYVDGA